MPRSPDTITAGKSVIPCIAAALILSVLIIAVPKHSALAQDAPQLTDTIDAENQIIRDLRLWRDGEPFGEGIGEEPPIPGLSESELGRLRTLINPDGSTSLERIPPQGSARGVPGPYPGIDETAGDDGNQTVTIIPPAERKPTFRIGIVPRGDVGRLLNNLEPMRLVLAKALSRPVEILPIASLSALIDAQVLKRVDLAFLSTSAYVTADQLCRCVEPLVAPLASDGTVASYALIVTRRDSDLSAIADLEGKQIAAAAPDSIAGRIYQLTSLMADGIDPDAYFAALTTTRSTVDAVLTMRDGLADAAFAWSSLAGPVSAGYTRGTFTTLVAQRMLGMNEIQIIWKSRPLTHGPVSVLKSIDDEDKIVLKEFFIALTETDPATYDILDAVYGGGYQPILPSDYHGARVLARQTIDARSGSAILPIPRLRPVPPAPTLPSTPPALVEPLREIPEPALSDSGSDTGALIGEPLVTGTPTPAPIEPDENAIIFLPAPPREPVQ